MTNSASHHFMKPGDLSGEQCSFNDLGRCSMFDYIKNIQQFTIIVVTLNSNGCVKWNKALQFAECSGFNIYFFKYELNFFTDDLTKLLSKHLPGAANPLKFQKGHVFKQYAPHLTNACSLQCLTFCHLTALHCIGMLTRILDQQYNYRPNLAFSCQYYLNGKSLTE